MGQPKQIDERLEWFSQLTRREPSTRRHRQFYAGLDNSIPRWPSVINSESFRAWALEHNSHTGTCLFQILYELWDEFSYGQFAVMLRLYLSEDKGRGRAERRKLLSGRYEIIRKLGTGGFGDVFLVWSWETTTLYALKTIKSELLDDPEILQRFKKEADCWVQCGAHPNIVRAYFLDKVDDAFYITLEYIESDVGGPSLAEKLGSTIEDRKLVTWFINVADGLRHAYTTGIRAHRDVKPLQQLNAQEEADHQVRIFLQAT